MQLIDYLTQNIGLARGIGDKYQAILRRYFSRGSANEREFASFGDLLMHLPYDYIDRRVITPLAQAKAGYNNLQLRPLQHFAPSKSAPYQPKARKPYRVQCEDDTGSIMLVFFSGDSKYLAAQLPIGEEILISGQLQRYDGMWQMNHPDIIGKAVDAEKLLCFEAIYPTTEGISSKMFARWIKELLKNMPDAPLWHLPSTSLQHKLLNFSEAIKAIHAPEDMQMVERARFSLAYDEAVAHQISLQALRAGQQKLQSVQISLLNNEAVARAIASLPFELTQGQKEVLAEINHDMAQNVRMLRLLQGDVGAGKTIIAALAMLAATSSRFQAAIMAPTEILARQHFAAISELLHLQGVAAIDGFEIIFLAGSLNAKARAEAYEKIKTAKSAMIIGTHALFQAAVEFANLGLIIIDEQHRFGVAQRLALSDKGGGSMRHFSPHLLLMTATPIPRSLAMANYGDMDISLLKQKPAGRQIIDTRTIGIKRLPEVLQGLARALDAGEKIYWICPLVEDLDDAILQSVPQMAELKAAETRFNELNQLFEGKVGLIHGRMAMPEREAVMQAFASGEIRVLVATTVVEVGVNVPDATIMIIENAQRFGLAQLHQLRGRVGRSDKPSRCLLLYDESCGEASKARLKTMRDTNDGFIIAEADWRLRGAGDLLGTKQTGSPDFKFLNLETQGDLLKSARREAMLHLQKSDISREIIMLLKIFNYDSSQRFLQGG